MRVDRIIFPVSTLGPGNRIVMWTCGCSKHCEKCANPELWSPQAGKEVSVEALDKIFHSFLKESTPVDGITVTGGDPLEQSEELAALLERLTDITRDILIYTGYTLEQAQELIPEEIFEKIKAATGVIIDGRYIDELNDDKCVLRGSTNQRTLILRHELADSYSEYEREGRKIQNIIMGSKVISIGIHNKQ